MLAQDSVGIRTRSGKELKPFDKKIIKKFGTGWRMRKSVNPDFKVVDKKPEDRKSFHREISVIKKETDGTEKKQILLLLSASPKKGLNSAKKKPDALVPRKLFFSETTNCAEDIGFENVKNPSGDKTSNKKVMGGISAKEALENYRQENPNLPSNVLQLIEQLIEEKHPMEWAHKVADNLGGAKTAANLAATTEKMNTAMMVLESTARYFANRYPKSVSVKPTFIMMPGSKHIVYEVQYQVKIEHPKTGITYTIENRINLVDLFDPRHTASTSDIKRIRLFLEEQLAEDSKSLAKKTQTPGCLV